MQCNDMCRILFNLTHKRKGVYEKKTKKCDYKKCAFYTRIVAEPSEKNCAKCKI